MSAMNALPFAQKFASMFRNLDQQTPQVAPLDADTVDQFGRTVRAKQIDLGLSGSGDMDVRRVVIESVDHEPEAEGAVDDDHPRLTRLPNLPHRLRHQVKNPLVTM